MSIEPKSLGLHGFLRYAIPGYIYLLVFLLPIFLTRSSFTIELNGSLVQSTVLLIAGPTIGYLIFHVYYPVFKRFGYNFENIPPFRIIEAHISKKLKTKGKDLRSLNNYQREYLVRAMEDFAVHSEFNPNVRPFDPNLRALRERMEFLFSSFHSLGTTVTAIWLGIISWIIVGAIDCTRDVSFKSLEFKLPLELFNEISLYTLVVYTFLAILWVFVSIILLRSFKHRKDLGITEEYLFALINRERIDNLISDYASEAEHFKNWDVDSRMKIFFRLIVFIIIPFLICLLLVLHLL